MRRAAWPPFVHDRADVPDQFQVGPFVASSDIVGFSRASTPEDRHDGSTVIANIEPVADVGAVAIYGNRLSVEARQDYGRDEFFAMLKRSIIVRTVGHHDR